MTSPAAPPQQAPQQPSQAGTAGLVAALAVVLASGLPPSTMIAAAIPLLATIGVQPTQAVQALALVIPHDLPLQAPGPVENRTAIHESLFRARYLVNASNRLRNGGTIEQERVYAQQHLGAQRARQEAAQKVDQAAIEHGPVLGWYAVLDSATTKDCRLASGKNFDPANPPRIGLPGSVHPACRCKAGPPHVGARTVDQATAHLFAPPDVIPFPVQLTNPRRKPTNESETH